MAWTGRRNRIGKWFSVRIVRRMYSGTNCTYHVDASGRAVRTVVPNLTDAGFDEGDAVTMTWSGESAFEVS